MDHDVVIPADGFAAVLEALPDLRQLAGGQHAVPCSIMTLISRILTRPFSLAAMAW